MEIIDKNLLSLGVKMNGDILSLIPNAKLMELMDQELYDLAISNHIKSWVFLVIPTFLREKDVEKIICRENFENIPKKFLTTKFLKKIILNDSYFIEETAKNGLCTKELFDIAFNNGYNKLSNIMNVNGLKTFLDKKNLETLIQLQPNNICLINSYGLCTKELLIYAMNYGFRCSYNIEKFKKIIDSKFILKYIIHKSNYPGQLIDDLARHGYEIKDEYLIAAIHKNDHQALSHYYPKNGEHNFKPYIWGAYLEHFGHNIYFRLYCPNKISAWIQCLKIQYGKVKARRSKRKTEKKLKKNEKQKAKAKANQLKTKKIRSKQIVPMVQKKFK